MAKIERLSVALPAPMASSVRKAVADGAYASTSEVIGDPPRLWQSRRHLLERDADADDNPATADRVVLRIDKKMQLLRRFPEIGALRNDLRRGMRTLIEGNYLLCMSTIRERTRSASSPSLMATESSAASSDP